MSKAPKQPFCYEYPRPAVTVDVVIVTAETQPRVLLIRRKGEPFAGHWAIPGGFVDMEEALETAARRELQEETGVTAGDLVQLHTFGAPQRDPRGRTISVAYLAVLAPEQAQARAGSDAAAVAWHRLHEPPPLAFDHAEILEHARQYLARTRAKKPRAKR